MVHHNCNLRNRTHAPVHWRSVSQSLDNVHGRQVGRQPITKNRERFQHLVRLHTAIIDLFCDSVSTMTLTALRSTPQLPTTTQGPCLAIPCGEIDSRFFAKNHWFYQCSFNPDWHGAWFPWCTWGTHRPSAQVAENFCEIRSIAKEMLAGAGYGMDSS